MKTQQEYLAGLNEQQADAVSCRSDILYVSAGPGTGKTMVLTSKMIDYIVSAETPQKIVALSYTNTAARQIGERFEKKAVQCGIFRNYSFYNGTIHSFCMKMMKSYGEAFDYTILDDEELSELAGEIKTQIPSDIPHATVMRCLQCDPREKDTQLFRSVSAVKEKLKVISIQDILSIFLRMLDENEGFRDWMATQITAMAIDEAQDLTELNYLILDRLIGLIPGLKVFLVGDPRQNIFEFNGGSYRNLEEFLSRHPGYELKTLTITYRCGQPISDFVNTFRFVDCKNYGLQPVNNWGRIMVMHSPSERDEADLVTRHILESGNLNACAVLSNNLRYLAPLITELRLEGIPYRVFGGQKLLKKHIRFLNHILRIVDTENAYSIRKISQYAGIDIVRDGKRRKSAFFESPLGRIIRSIAEESRQVPFPVTAERVVKEIMSDPEDDEKITEDYRVFLGMATEYGCISDYLDSFATDRERFTCFYLSDYEECPVSTENGFLTISTIHSAKGLEWDTVFIMGLCEGNFPNPYFCQNLTPFEQEEFFNNEWKKMYVAATRARKNLYLTYSTSITRKGYSFQKVPSRFISNQISA